MPDDTDNSAALIQYLRDLPFFCGYCHCRFRTRWDFDSHNRRSHFGEPTWPSPPPSAPAPLPGPSSPIRLSAVLLSSPFFCATCQYHLPSESDLLFHRLKIHSDEDRSPPPPPAAASSRSKDNVPAPSTSSHGPYFCALCHTHFINRRQLKAHDQKTHDGRSGQRVRSSQRVVCPFCERAFSRVDSLNRHLAKAKSGCPNRPTIVRSGAPVQPHGRGSTVGEPESSGVDHAESASRAVIREPPSSDDDRKQ